MQNSFFPLPSRTSARSPSLLHPQSSSPSAQLASQHHCRPSPAERPGRNRRPRSSPAADARAPLVGAVFIPARLGTARARRCSNRRPRRASWERSPCSSALLNSSRASPPTRPCCAPLSLALAVLRNHRSSSTEVRRPHLRTDHCRRASPSSFFPAVRIPWPPSTFRYR